MCTYIHIYIHVSLANYGRLSHFRFWIDQSRVRTKSERVGGPLRYARRYDMMYGNYYPELETLKS